MTQGIVRRSDYRPPSWLVPELALEFDLDVTRTEVTSRFRVHRGAGPEAPVRLDGEGLELLGVRINGAALDAGDWTLDATGLTLPGAEDGAEIEIRVGIRPAENTALEGLYLSGSAERGFLLTQCEAQGFRRITYFPDRPDVLARYTVTLRADKARFPVLLAGGNPAGAGELEDGRHWVRCVDPWPKPSYLFALVAGRLEHIERHFTTSEGRRVQVRLWSEAETIGRCHFAMEALLRAMRWDEATYGRAFDLDVFNVVATQDFNMGAMENKGLNIFNAKYLLIDPPTSTDADYRHVEAVIGHEYFHNWSGNRVTCRDWFELSLKEGFTVFREQSFAAAMTSPLVQRIEDVTRLRRVQFAEDAGPLAHPVRPQSYSEINNFYTTTVYEKGAELVRMLATRLGPDRFRRGTDLYFSRHDGAAVTIDDFVAALGEASGMDLAPWLAWYAQAGTPRLRVTSRFDAAARTLTLTVEQHTPPTPGQPEKQPLPIPLAVLLLDAAGQPLAARRPGAEKAQAGAHFLDITAAREELVYHEVGERPVLSLLRGFSAPVQLETDQDDADLAVLVRHEPDDFNRWQAGAELVRRAFRAELEGGAAATAETLAAALGELLERADDTDPWLLARLLAPADEVELGEGLDPWDPRAVHAAREALLAGIATRLGAATIHARYRHCVHAEAGHISAAAQARRALKNALLGLLRHVDPERAAAEAERQYDAAASMSDRLGALACLLRLGVPAAARATAQMRERHATDPLALDKWFALQATVPGPETLGQVRKLLRDPAFSLRNPNKVQALLGSYSRANPSAFHRADGAGAQLLAETIVQLDAINPQGAARLTNAWGDWRRLVPALREPLHETLRWLAARQENSRGLAEMATRLLGAG